MAATIANENGPLVRVVQPTLKRGAADAIGQQALRLITAACTKAGVSPDHMSRVGVSSCGPFAFEQGALGLISPNLCGGLARSEDLPNDWDFIPLESILRSQFSDVVIENDCVAALTAERCFGAAQQEPNSVYVTWSTGIGFGLCVDGHILRGKHGNAGHAGHMLLSESSDALCGCGNRGDLEALISGRNLGKRVGRPAPDIFTAAQAGDPASLAIVQEAARWLGRGLYNLAATLDTRCFLVGGSVWLHHAGLLAPLIEAEITSRFSALTEGVSVRGAALGELVTDIGALALVLPDAWMDGWRAQTPWTSLRSYAADEAG
jgi:glucokinase